FSAPTPSPLAPLPLHDALPISLHERAAVRVAAHVVARHVRPNCPGLSGEAWLAGSLPHLPQPSPPIPDAQDEPVACPLFFILKAGRAGVMIHVWRMSHYSIRRPAELARPPRSSGRGCA